MRRRSPLSLVLDFKCQQASSGSDDDNRCHHPQPFRWVSSSNLRPLACLSQALLFSDFLVVLDSMWQHVSCGCGNDRYRHRPATVSVLSLLVFPGHRLNLGYALLFSHSLLILDFMEQHVSSGSDNDKNRHRLVTVSVLLLLTSRANAWA